MRTIAAFMLLYSSALAVDYPTAFLCAPRDPAGGFFRVQSVSEQNGPYVYHPNTDLRILNPDGTERLLVQGQQGNLLAVHDACMSLDGTRVYYSHIGKDAIGEWCDLYVIPLAGGAATKLTDGKTEFAPPSGYFPAGAKRYVWNSAPCDTPNGLVFVSNRSGVVSPGEGYIANQSFLMDHDGKNVQKTGHLNLGGVAHPFLMPNGRVGFSTGEQQGLRSMRGGAWGIWSMNPDGSDWRPEHSAIPPVGSFAMHHGTVTSDGTQVLEGYYDTRVYGFVVAIPPYQPSPFDPPTQFGSPLRQNNPMVKLGYYPDTDRFRDGNFIRFSFQRRGMYNPLPWAKEDDSENVGPDGTKYGMVAHPRAIPGNGVQLTWTGAAGDVQMNLGIYSLPDIQHEYIRPQEMTVVVDKPDRHEWMPMPCVAWKAIYGSDPPKIQRRTDPDLPPGSPYATIGSSNVFWHEIVKASTQDQTDSLVTFANSDVKWLRVIAFNPTTEHAFSQPINNAPFNAAPNDRREGFSSAYNEREGFYEQLIPIESDGSFKAYIPADQPVSFQLLNAKGEVLADAHTWHQVRPGEIRTDCRGCHAHEHPAPEEFENQIAGQRGYAAVKLDKVRIVEYERDIRSIDERLSLGLGPRPWFSNDAAKQGGHSLLNTVDEDQRLTGAEAWLLRAWQDTGYLATGKFADGTLIKPEHGTGPYADNVPPTLNVVGRYIGVCDPQSGLKDGSLSVKADVAIGGHAAGEELAGLYSKMGDVFILAATITLPPCMLTASIRDNQRATDAQVNLTSEEGNITRVVRTIGESLPSGEDCAAVTAERDALRIENAALKAKIQAAKAALE